MFKVNNKDTRTTPIFIVNIEHNSHLVPVFLLLTLSWKMSAGLKVIANLGLLGKLF